MRRRAAGVSDGDSEVSRSGDAEACSRYKWLDIRSWEGLLRCRDAEEA